MRRARELSLSELKSLKERLFISHLALFVCWTVFPWLTFYAFTRLNWLSLITEHGILHESEVIAVVSLLRTLGAFYIAMALVELYVGILMLKLRFSHEIVYSKFWRAIAWLIFVFTISCSSFLAVAGTLLILKSSILIERYEEAYRILMRTLLSGSYHITPALAYFEYGKRLVLSGTTDALAGYVTLKLLAGFVMMFFFTNWPEQNTVVGSVLVALGAIFATNPVIFIIGYLTPIGYALIAVGIRRVVDYEMYCIKERRRIEKVVATLWPEKQVKVTPRVIHYRRLSL